MREYSGAYLGGLVERPSSAPHRHRGPPPTPSRHGRRDERFESVLSGFERGFERND